MAFNPGSRSRLTPRDLPRFAGDTLFDALARAVCEAECLPRKELFEAWEVARRVRRRVRGGPVLDLAAGHGLLAWALLLLDDTSPWAECVDRTRPPSADRLAAVLTGRWPRLAGRVRYREGDLDAAEAPRDALVVSVHACGGLTDRVLDVALAARARVAVLPCCHALDKADAGGLEGWLDGPVAIDVVRAARLRAAGYAVHTATIPAAITPMNRLLLGVPAEPGAPP